MRPLTVVLLQSNQIIADSLTDSLSGSVESVLNVKSLEDLRATLPMVVSAAIILDIESVPLREVSRLAEEYPATNIVCNHRTPDERMWVQTMNAGASDCCSSSDVTGIVRAVLADTSLWAAA